jgi:hypothetical protein
MLDKDVTLDNDEDASAPSEAKDATAGLVDTFKSMVIY